MTAFMFHEIRNPLHVIVLSTEYLLDNFARKLDPEVKSELQSIACSSGHLEATLSCFLHFDKILNSNSKAVNLPQENFTLGSIIKKVKHMTRHTVKQGVDINYYVDSKVANDVLVGAPTHLHLMVLNMLTNSFRYTTRGSVELRFDIVRSDNETATVRIMVTDTGSGLNSDIVEHLYSLRTTSHSKGYGIGLFVVNKLTSIMGGKLEARSPIREKDEYGGPGR